MTDWRPKACLATTVHLLTTPAIVERAAPFIDPDCLAWALETGQSDGIWGGRTADERRVLRRARRQRHPRLRRPTDDEQETGGIET
jgi:Transcription factor WhiB